MYTIFKYGQMEILLSKYFEMLLLSKAVERLAQPFPKHVPWNWYYYKPYLKRKTQVRPMDTMD